jgi:hypothetical protein
MRKDVEIFLSRLVSETPPNNIISFRLFPDERRCAASAVGTDTATSAAPAVFKNLACRSHYFLFSSILSNRPPVSPGDSITNAMEGGKIHHLQRKDCKGSERRHTPGNNPRL